MKTIRFLQFFPLTLAMVFGIAACGGKPTKPDAKDNAALGEQQLSEGEVAVQTQREVTRTVQTQTEIPSIRVTTIKGDLNRMEPKHLIAIGVPNDVALNIIQYRKDHEGFQSLAQLQEVDGMSRNLFQQLVAQVAIAPQQ